MRYKITGYFVNREPGETQWYNVFGHCRPSTVSIDSGNGGLLHFGNFSFAMCQIYQIIKCFNLFYTNLIHDVLSDANRGKVACGGLVPDGDSVKFAVKGEAVKGFLSHVFFKIGKIFVGYVR